MFFLKELPDRTTLERYRDRFPMMNVDNVDAALHMLRRASLLMRELDGYFARNGLSTLRYLILIVLDRENDGNSLKISALAERLDVSRPVMTRAIRALSAAALIRVDADAGDSRIKRIHLTETGRQTLIDILPDYYRLIDRFMATNRPHLTL